MAAPPVDIAKPRQGHGPFDTYRFVEQLEQAGVPRDQAVVLMEQVLLAISEANTRQIALVSRVGLRRSSVEVEEEAFLETMRVGKTGIPVHLRRGTTDHTRSHGCTPSQNDETYPSPKLFGPLSNAPSCFLEVTYRQKELQLVIWWDKLGFVPNMAGRPVDGRHCTHVLARAMKGK